MSDDSLLRRLPPIRRARDYRLYGENGKRYLDLWQAGGRALLGHRSERVLTELKNHVSRGLLADLPSIHERRLVKALGLLMPGFSEFRIYRNAASLLDALSAFGGSGFEAEGLPDPATAETDGLPLALWRPFLSEEVGALPGGDSPPGGAAATEGRGGPAVAVPVLPFPSSGAPAVAAFRDPPGERARSGEVVSPALLAALSKSIFQLIRFREEYTEHLWRSFDAPFWRRKGPYLVARGSREEYAALFGRLLEKGILISPRYPGPSIVPAIFTEGEIKPLRTAEKG